MPISRRAFLAWAAANLPIAVVVDRAHAAAITALSSGSALTSTLHALGDIVLPSELGADGIMRAVNSFRRWMTGYREHAELTHGYGTSRIRYSGPTPATRWTAQLDALDALARKGYGASFASLVRERREELVRRALAAERQDRMPSVAEADHVAIALISHFFGSSEATDLCYGVAIGRERCRSLAESSRAPVPLGRRGDA